MSEDTNNPPDTESEKESDVEWVKQRISDEEIINMQAEMAKMRVRLDNSAKMLHQRDLIIRKQAQLLESYAINMIVLARNSQGLIDQSSEIELE